MQVAFSTSPHASGNSTHILRNPEAPRVEWRTLCGRDASGHNTSTGDTDDTRFEERTYSCSGCIRRILK